MRRQLPPLVSDTDRQEAAHIQADKLCAVMREEELLREMWTEAPARWSHWIDSMGGITSERLDSRAARPNP